MNSTMVKRATNEQDSAKQLQFILREQEEVNKLEARRNKIERAHAEAHATFLRAQAALDDATEELNYTRSRFSHVVKRLYTLRQSFRRDMMQRLPDDILLYVFMACVSLPEDFLHSTLGTECYSDEHARAPFAVAAVCSRWRTIALNQPNLWTYISVPNQSEPCEHVSASHLSRIDLLLRRSASAPLDILLDLRYGYTDDNLPWAELSFALDNLMSHAVRWRTVELYFGQNLLGRRLLTQCCGPLPVLRRLIFESSRSKHNHENSNHFLPFAPCLSVLDIKARYPVDFAASTVAPRLTSLRLDEQFASLSKFIGFLKSIAPTLVLLAVRIPLESITDLDIPSIALLLPQLQELELDPSWFELPTEHIQHWVLPRLRHVHIIHPYGGGTAWLDRLSDRIAEVTIHVDSGYPLFSELKCLRSVERVVFLNPPATFPDIYSFAEVLNDDFFATKSEWIEERMWPRLRSIVFTENVIPPYDAFLTFLTWRTSNIDTVYPSFPRPSRIEEVKVSIVGFEYQWFEAEVNRLLCNTRGLNTQY